MAAAAILEKFQMAISPQRLTIYLYSAHRAVIFAIAQLSCFLSRGYSLLLTNIFTVVNTFGILLKRIHTDQNGTLHWQIYSVRPKTFHLVNGVRFSEIICKRTRILSKILHAYYVLIISTTTSDKISFSYLEIRRNYAMLCATALILYAGLYLYRRICRRLAAKFATP